MLFSDPSFRLAAIYGAVIFVVAALLRLVRGAPRVRLRRSVLLFVGYLLVLGARTLVGNHAGAAVAQGFRFADALVALLLAVHLGALIVFDLGLRALRWRPPDILHDLTVGTAYVVATFWLMHGMGVNVTGIVATSAVVTAVIGLSLQSTLGNVIGGLTLQVDDSLREGDWIEFENKTQGLVKKVRWRHTVIETRDWDTLIVPNSQLVAQTIKILGRREGHPVQHRMWVYFNVDHRYPPREVIRVVDEALQSAPLPGVAAEPKPHVIVHDFARDGRDSFAYYAVRYWLTDIGRNDHTSSAVRERLYAALQRAQIPLALPAAALFLTRDDSEKSERKRQRALESHKSALRGVSLFSNLSEGELTRLAESAKRAPFAAGEMITRQGAQAHYLYVLVSGQVDVLVSTDGGAERLVATLRAPAFFGEMALLTGEAREATVVAKGVVECLRVDKDGFGELLSVRPELAREVAAILAERRVGLEAAKGGLDVDARTRRIAHESRRILASLKDFFALES
ncbi:MAG TPA: mechanosensitive ion channel family protein [Polyangiaceae bacterium]|jgi:small-conductance mechanosensitive channel/CRP-like cAMP-binding protein|nr:mechanosensitive ion channel family protein [Polyangiaceae bacterium]